MKYLFNKRPTAKAIVTPVHQVLGGLGVQNKNCNDCLSHNLTYFYGIVTGTTTLKNHARLGKSRYIHFLFGPPGNCLLNI